MSLLHACDKIAVLWPETVALRAIEPAGGQRGRRRGRCTRPPMWIGLLGSLQVQVDVEAVAVPAARQRALLAVLAVRARELVPTDELAETLWDGMPPDRAADTIRNYVKRLRLRLGPAGMRIVTGRPSGYRLEVAEDDLDLRVFARLCRDGGEAMRTGDWEGAFEGLGQAPISKNRQHVCRVSHAVVACEPRDPPCVPGVLHDRGGEQ